MIDDEMKIGLHILALTALHGILRVLYMIGAGAAVGITMVLMLSHLAGWYRVLTVGAIVWLCAVSYVGYQQLNYSFNSMIGQLLLDEAGRLGEDEK